jgi:hypothetical protein
MLPGEASEKQSSAVALVGSKRPFDRLMEVVGLLVNNAGFRFQAGSFFGHALANHVFYRGDLDKLVAGHRMRRSAHNLTFPGKQCESLKFKDFLLGTLFPD